MGYTITPLPAPSYGLSSERPATASPGAFYFETDTKKTYQYDGSWKFLHVIPDQSWIPFPLANGWANYSGNTPTNVDYGVARYRRHADLTVEVQGLIKNAAVQVFIGQLPAGYRPTNRLIFDNMSNSLNNSRVDVQYDGWLDFMQGDPGYLSINLRFFADQ